MRFAFVIALLASMSTFAAEVPPDITVAADGSGQFKTVQAAVASIPKENRERKIILIKDGVYNEKVRVDASCVTLRGQSRAGARIEFAQLNDDFTAKPDDLGRAVLNVNGDDFVLENLTVKNTAGIVGPHSFSIFGRGDRTVIVDCDVLSEGADTVSLWKGDTGRYYHARCNFRGAVDFVCPRGWCYLTDCTFYETKKGSAAVWHDGSKNKDQKFVLHNCKFDGIDGWVLARHHADAQFYFLDCTFTNGMVEKQPLRVIYPLDGKTPTDADIKKNKDGDARNQWGERTYFSNCHRDGGDFDWFKDNLPLPKEKITPAWTFDGTWDPESMTGPKITKIERKAGHIEVTFSESVSVRGKPKLKLGHGASAEYTSGSGGETLSFKAESDHGKEVEAVELNDGAIIASQASAGIRTAELAVKK